MNNAYIRAQQCKVKEAKFPFVKIGTQYWTTKNLSLAVTPQGTVIQEMQANGNVEKVVNGGFATDTLWNKIGTWTISGGTASCNSGTVVNGGNAYIFQSTSSLVIGKIYKATFTIISITSGSIGFRAGGTNSVFFGVVGTYTVYIAPSTTSNYGVFTNQNTVATINNVSFQETGWSGSQELYDGIYAQTAGTVEQKTYAAVKAAAMWSNYNNDAPTGLIYGKILNGFARRLINMDIAYYNAANPTKPYVCGLPTKAQIQLLDTNGGNSLKAIGTTYLNDANGTNVTGFNAYGSGKRNTDGTFSGLKSNALFWVIGTNEVLQLESANNNATVISASEVEGYAIRLIKA